MLTVNLTPSLHQVKASLRTTSIHLCWMEGWVPQALLLLLTLLTPEQGAEINGSGCSLPFSSALPAWVYMASLPVLWAGDSETSWPLGLAVTLPVMSSRWLATGVILHCTSSSGDAPSCLLSSHFPGFPIEACVDHILVISSPMAANVVSLWPHQAKVALKVVLKNMAL